LFPKKDPAVTVYRPEQAQFAGIEVKFKTAEPDATCEILCHGHLGVYFRAAWFSKNMERVDQVTSESLCLSCLESIASDPKFILTAK
jgi:hypothetical protein